MKKRVLSILLLIPLLFLSCIEENQTEKENVKLIKDGSAFSLIVDGEPFIMLGGELGNSTAAHIDNMKDVWPRLKAMKLNTALVPVYWELIEPAEGQFDFKLVEDLIVEARKNDIKLVFLWFGSWKNSMSCYAPLWVKQDWERFPRAFSKDGTPQEIMTPFSKENLETDKKAYLALLNHIAEFDKNDRTVIMMQIENEIGMIPDARDYCSMANEAFFSEVPEQLKNMVESGNMISEHITNLWNKNNSPKNGNWEEMFGKNLFTDELFMTWYYALYVEELAKEGKEVYDLPVYLNAALNSRGRAPGAYPSAGPLAHLIDIWRTVSPSVDFIAPDIYDPGFANWCSQYDVPGINPLFIPEIRNEDGNDARVFYALGAHNALGFSPFSIEDTPNPENAPLTKSYEVLHQLLPLIAKKQVEGKISGVLFYEDVKDTTITFGNYKFNISHDYTLGWSPKANDGSKWPETGALILQMNDDEFIVAGTGVVLTFESVEESIGRTGIGEIDRIKNINGEFIPTLRLNGDQNHQGRHLRIPQGDYDIQKLTLYRYY